VHVFIWFNGQQGQQGLQEHRFILLYPKTPKKKMLFLLFHPDSPEALAAPVAFSLFPTQKK